MVIRFLICIISLSLLSCAGTETIKNTSERISGRGYSLLPPQEEGWRVLNKGSSGIGMLRKGENIDETYAVVIELIEFQDTINSKIVLDAFVELLQKQQFASERFEIVELKNMPDPERKACTKSFWIEKDFGAKRMSGIQDPMFVKAYDIYCVHPHNKAYLAVIGYSHRYYEGNEDPIFTQKAFDFFKNVSLTEF